MQRRVAFAAERWTLPIPAPENPSHAAVGYVNRAELAAFYFELRHLSDTPASLRRVSQVPHTTCILSRVIAGMEWLGMQVGRRLPSPAPGREAARTWRALLHSVMRHCVRLYPIRGPRQCWMIVHTHVG